MLSQPPQRLMHQLTAAFTRSISNPFYVRLTFLGIVMVVKVLKIYARTFIALVELVNGPLLRAVMEPRMDLSFVRLITFILYLHQWRTTYNFSQLCTIYLPYIIEFGS